MLAKAESIDTMLPLLSLSQPTMLPLSQVPSECELLAWAVSEELDKEEEEERWRRQKHHKKTNGSKMEEKNVQNGLGKKGGGEKG